MYDKGSELKNINELKFSQEQGFFDKSIGIRWLIAALFFFSLFIYLHFRDVRVETLELNTTAPSYVVAQVDFDFFDEEATIILKQEAVRDIGKIFEVSQKEIRKRRDEFEDFLVKNQDWREQVGDSTFEEMYQAMDSLENVMLQLRFTDPRTLKKMHEVNLDTQNYMIFTPADLTERTYLPVQIWEQIADKALPADEYQAVTKQYIVSFFQGKGWMFEEDIPSQRKLRRSVQASVPDKYTHVTAGNRIIDQGDKVTARHIAMLQAMKAALSERRNLWHPLTLLGSFIMTLLLTVICYAYLHMNHKSILLSNRKLFLLVSIIIITLVLSKLTEFFLLSSMSNLIDIIRYPIFVPFAAIMICSLLNAHLAAFASGFLVIISTMTLAFDVQGFMIMNLATAIVAILSTRTLRQRKEIFIVCGKAWLCSVLVAFSINFYGAPTWWGVGVIADIAGAGFFMLLTAVLVVGLLPLFESLFHIMTDVSLMEYMDPSNTLLRRLSIEAPGTYQHSVVVGNLAEAAAVSIGANGLFCRVSTLYHDIGKMVTPQYFTENQQAGMNIHQLLTPLESAQVIIAHVTEGVSMARKAGLPEQFIDIIKEHHGTTLVYYFYKKQLEKLNGDITQVDEKEFRYAGPRPRSKESAIIMIADTLEAASRSLEVVNEETISELSDRLIKEKADDGQFDECLLTFEELAIVKETLIKTLCAFAHSRVKYPSRDNHHTK